jgi:hypothetical protein
MVESEEQIAHGIESGQFKSNDFVNVANETYRICAPTISNKNISSVILWTKSSKDDKPDWSKVVCILRHFNKIHYLISLKIGGFVYNLERLHEMFSSNSSEVQDDIEATATYLRQVWTIGYLITDIKIYQGK